MYNDFVMSDGSIRSGLNDLLNLAAPNICEDLWLHNLRPQAAYARR